VRTSSSLQLSLSITLPFGVDQDEIGIGCRGEASKRGRLRARAQPRFKKVGIDNFLNSGCCCGRDPVCTPELRG
jgi:hypothetical protein